MRVPMKDINSTPAKGPNTIIFYRAEESHVPGKYTYKNRSLYYGH